MKKENALILLALLTGLILRVFWVLFSPGGLSNDAQSYYRCAINVVEGRGYSEFTEEPYTPFYFREPLTVYSIVPTMWITKHLLGEEHIDYPTTWDVAEMDAVNRKVIFAVRFINDILQLAGLFLLFLIIKRYAGFRFALAFLWIAMIYFPLIFYPSLVLREPYLFFFLSLLTFLWEIFVRTKSRIFLSLSALTTSAVLMYLHLYMLLLLFFVPVVWIVLKQLSAIRRIGYILLFVILTFLPTVPWIATVYNYYPDIRVAKTLGAALNTDYTNCLNAYRAHGVDPYYAVQGDLPNDIEVRNNIFVVRDVKDVFQWTFDGTYSNEAKRINAANTTEKIISYYWGRIVEAFRNNVFIVGITYDYGIFYGHFSVLDILKFLFCLPFILIGLLALCGVWPIFKRYWFLMPAFCYHALFFAAYGDEERRTYMLVPYIIVFAMAALYLYWCKISNKTMTWQ